MRDIVVLGAGVVGMTTAYVLARNGFAVTVIDAGSSPAERGASFGNGSQLSYSYTDAMASPSMVANLPKYLLGRDPAFRIRMSASPRFLEWGLRFLGNSSQRSFERNTIDVLKLAMESRQEFSYLANKVAFDHRQSGKLNLYACHESLEKARKLSDLKNTFGANQAILERDEAIEREPALAHYGHSFVGALWSPDDESGDSRLFCQGLKALLEDEFGTRFLFDTRIHALKTNTGRLEALATDRGELPARLAVLALGTWSASIARSVGIRLPIWPVQGYSMTLPATEYAPLVSITDTTRKTVFCRIGNRLRIAGLADIGPGEALYRHERFETLFNTAQEIFPKAGDYSGEVGAWTGLRPVTPNSQPILGKSKVTGLFLNCGHGSLGWTLSMASAVKVASEIADVTGSRKVPMR